MRAPTGSTRPGGPARTGRPVAAGCGGAGRLPARALLVNAAAAGTGVVRIGVAVAVRAVRHRAARTQALPPHGEPTPLDRGAAVARAALVAGRSLASLGLELRAANAFNRWTTCLSNHLKWAATRCSAQVRHPRPCFTAARGAGHVRQAPQHYNTPTKVQWHSAAAPGGVSMAEKGTCVP